MYTSAQYPQGFTETPEVKAILDRYTPEFLYGTYPNNRGDYRHIDMLTYEALVALLELLPPAQATDQQNAAPTFKQMIEIGKKYPGTLFHGYHITSGRSDERVTIEGYYRPIEYGKRRPRNVDEWDEVELEVRPGDKRKFMRAWWD